MCPALGLEERLCCLGLVLEPVSEDEPPEPELGEDDGKHHRQHVAVELSRTQVPLPQYREAKDSVRFMERADSKRSSRIERKEWKSIHNPCQDDQESADLKKRTQQADGFSIENYQVKVTIHDPSEVSCHACSWTKVV